MDETRIEDDCLPSDEEMEEELDEDDDDCQETDSDDEDDEEIADDNDEAINKTDDNVNKDDPGPSKPTNVVPLKRTRSAMKTTGRPRKKRKGKPATKRKNIRKILDKEQLNEQALDAQQQERERLLRLEQQRNELQKFFAAQVTQRVRSESSDQEVTKTEAVTIDTQRNTNDDAIATSSSVVVDVDQLKLKKPTYDICILDSSDDSDIETIETIEKPCYINNKIKPFIDDEEIEIAYSEDGKVFINMDHSSNEEDVYLTSLISKAVKPHQVGGIKFMYDNLVETLSHYRKDTGFGCILAHAMGLGKTLQTISFIDIFLRYTPAKKVLCIVPINTLHNWLAEFNRWLPDTLQTLSSTAKNIDEESYRKFSIFFMGETHKTNTARASLIEQWDDEGGVLLIGYEMYRMLSLYSPTMYNAKAFDKGKRKSKAKQKAKSAVIDIEEEEKEMKTILAMQKSLCDPGPDLVVCDEGHRIKNFKSGISKALGKIATRKRLVLTGYPLQNNLVEYWCMVDFVRPNYLGTRQEFSNMFARPIVNGQCSDSTEQDRQVMRYRVHVLFGLLQGFVQRRNHDVLVSSLPPKEEMVIMVRMSPIQKALYCKYVDVIQGKAYGESTLNPIVLFSLLCKIWNHPDILYNAMMAEKYGKKMNLFESDDMADSPSAPQPQNESQSKLMSFPVSDWASDVFKKSNFRPGDASNSGKMSIFLRILNDTIAMGEKLLVFSQSLLTLDSIEEALRKGTSAASRIGWAKNTDYYRLDGSTTGSERERLINLFNNPENLQAKLFLISTKAGCLGINLTAASRVVVFDVSWNPCYDAQAICRIYRYGQTKPCFIYRLVASNTMETKMYYRQISKIGIADRVVDERNLWENLTKKDIGVLMDLEWNHEPTMDYSDAMTRYCDGLLITLCLELSQWITKDPFKHESLLVSAANQTLTNEEKQEAQRSYEEQKRMNVPAQNAGLGISNIVTVKSTPLDDPYESKQMPHLRPIVSVRPMMVEPSLALPSLNMPGSSTVTSSQAYANLLSSNNMSSLNVRNPFSALSQSSTLANGNPLASIDPMALLSFLAASSTGSANLINQAGELEAPALLRGGESQATIVLPRLHDGSSSNHHVPLPNNHHVSQSVTIDANGMKRTEQTNLSYTPVISNTKESAITIDDSDDDGN